jgi:hypothetical protein
MNGADFIEHTISNIITPVATGVSTTPSAIASINIYPNPATSEITIAWQNQSVQNADVVISDLLGNEVLKTTISLIHSSGSTHIALPDIANGTYMISISSATNYYSGKLVILKQ